LHFEQEPKITVDSTSNLITFTYYSLEGNTSVHKANTSK